MTDMTMGMTPAAPEPNMIPTPGAVPVQGIVRDAPTPDAERAALVTEIVKWCNDTKSYRSKTFDMMRRNVEFARPGKQWKGRSNTAPDDEPYEANLIQNHIKSRTAALYAKNPTVVAKRRQRLEFSIWDNDPQKLEAVLMKLQPPQPAMPGAMPMPPQMPTEEDLALLADVQQGMERRKLLERVGKTLEVLYRYQMQEGTPPFKEMAKQLIRRVETTGVGWVQLGFQRMMGANQDITNRIRDSQLQLDHLEAMAADVEQGYAQDNMGTIEALRLSIKSLQEQEQIVLREGLVFDFPASTDILVGRECLQLKGLVNSRRVAREYHYTREEIKEIFKVDVGDNYKRYSATKTWEATARADASRNRNAGDVVACVWAVWDAATQLVYYVCDGWPDFLREPEAPEIEVEGFFPFYALSFNDMEDPNNIYPPSDVEILRPMQLEYNRCREGIREHRIQNKPVYMTYKGAFDDENKVDMRDSASGDLIELNMTQEQVKDIGKSLVGRPTIEINPINYDVEGVMTDILRVSNSQEANFGGTTGATATETSIAEAGRVSSIQSNIDDLDAFLTTLARAGGQILMKNMSIDQVKKICGPGAVWPEASREELAEEIYLEIQAASSGRPNKALEVSYWERLGPIFLQTPGVNPKWVLRKMSAALDENMDIDEAFMPGIPSIVAQNAIDGAQGPQPQLAQGDATLSPDQQGGEGARNAIGVPTSQPGPRPNIPIPGGGGEMAP